MPLLGTSHTKQHDSYEGWVPAWKGIRVYIPPLSNSTMNALAQAKIPDNSSSVKQVFIRRRDIRVDDDFSLRECSGKAQEVNPW